MTTTLERVSPSSDTGRRRPLVWISAAAFAISSVWFALIETGVTQAAESEASNASQGDALRAHYVWFATTLQQERVVTGVAILGLATLVASVWELRGRLGAGSAATAGALAVWLGSVVWIMGNVIQLGGDRAVGLMASNSNPIETTNSIAFTVAMIDDAVELVAFAMLGVGMACLAIAAWRMGGATRSWSRCTAGFALVLVALAIAHGMADTHIADVLLVVVGAALTPAWLLWAGRVGADPASAA